jgi:hypothetical protein
MTIASTTSDAISEMVRNGGHIQLPPGVFEIEKPIVLRPGVYSFRGAGIEATQLVYKGDPSRPLIQVDRGVWNADIGGFTLRGNKQGVGLRACQDERPTSYVGTVCGSNRYDSISIFDFDVGVQLGDAGHTATSENRFARLSIRGCRNGVLLTDYNTLNNHFDDFNFSEGEIGIFSTQGGGETHIDGGSASAVGNPKTDHYKKAVFAFTSGGTYSVKRFRQGEGGTASFLRLSGSDTDCSISDCTVLGTHPFKDWVVDCYYQTSLLMTASRLDGCIHCGSIQGAVTAQHVTTRKKNLFDISPVGKGSISQLSCASVRPDGQRVLLADFVKKG